MLTNKLCVLPRFTLKHLSQELRTMYDLVKCNNYSKLMVVDWRLEAKRLLVNFTTFRR